jgi:hypothetical protein
MDGKEICDRLGKGQFVNDPEVTESIDRLTILYDQLSSQGKLAAADPVLQEYIEMQHGLLGRLRGTVTPENLLRAYQHMKRLAEDEAAFAGRYNAEMDQ